MLRKKPRNTEAPHINIQSPKKTPQHIKFSHKKKYCGIKVINGVLNVLRLLIENNKISDIQNYKEKLKDIDKFDFKKYKSSQYRKMGKDIYAKYFENAI